MSFDDAINKVLQEQYFGGSPFEQASGIKKHIVFEDSGGDKGKIILKRFFEDHAPYYSRDLEDIEKWPDHRGGTPTKKSPRTAVFAGVLFVERLMLSGFLFIGVTPDHGPGRQSVLDGWVGRRTR